MSRVCAQAYDRLGEILGPIITGLKIVTSRTEELTEAAIKMDVPDFMGKKVKFMRVLPETKNIKPFKRTLLQEGNKFTGCETEESQHMDA